MVLDNRFRSSAAKAGGLGRRCLQAGCYFDGSVTRPMNRMLPESVASIEAKPAPDVECTGFTIVSGLFREG